MQSTRKLLMLRRGLPLLCYGSEDRTNGGNFVKVEYQPLQEAFTIFQLDPQKEIKTKDVKKRFTKLAIQYHPDHGGDEVKFQKLVKAKKTLLAYAHDKGGKEGRFNFKNMSTKDNIRGHKEPRMKKDQDDKVPDEFDPTIEWFHVAFFIFFFGGMLMMYMSRAKEEALRLMKSRGRLREEDVKPLKGSSEERNWHPWSASQNLKDELRTVEAITRGVSEEIKWEKELGVGAFGSVNRSELMKNEEEGAATNSSNSEKPTKYVPGPTPTPPSKAQVMANPLARVM